MGWAAASPPPWAWARWGSRRRTPPSASSLPGASCLSPCPGPPPTPGGKTQWHTAASPPHLWAATGTARRGSRAPPRGAAPQGFHLHGARRGAGPTCTAHVWWGARAPAGAGTPTRRACSTRPPGAAAPGTRSTDREVPRACHGKRQVLSCKGQAPCWTPPSACPPSPGRPAAPRRPHRVGCRRSGRPRVSGRVSGIGVGPWRRGQRR